MAKLIADAWDSYARNVVPADACAEQKTETRRAFYAGAQSLLVAMLTGLDPESDMTEGDMDRMDGIHVELRQFARDVEAGIA